MLFAVVLLSVMNKEILLGDKARRPTQRNIFMKSINEFDALLSNRSALYGGERNEKKLATRFADSAVDGR